MRQLTSIIVNKVSDTGQNCPICGRILILREMCSRLSPVACEPYERMICFVIVMIGGSGLAKLSIQASLVHFSGGCRDAFAECGASGMSEL